MLSLTASIVTISIAWQSSPAKAFHPCPPFHRAVHTGPFDTVPVCIPGDSPPTPNPTNPAPTPPTNQAQLNFNGTPTYGSVRLQAGFTPDPYRVNVVAGGETNATNLQLGQNCVGFVAAGQPDFRVGYEAGSYPLSFFVESTADTTLIINGPNGEWYCNDDYSGNNPRVTLSRPTSGQYDIWVGTYGSTSNPQTTLSITEL
jgi:hypothetical protein